MSSPFLDPFRLDGKTVLVTGASSGIGQAIAVQASQVGAQLVLSGRDTARLEAVHASLAGSGHRFLPADLTDTAQIQTLADAVGAVDGVVHSAGVDGVAPMRMLTEKMLDRVLKTNYYAPMLLTQRQLARQWIHPGGSVLLLGSIAALTGKVGVGPYSGSKSALIGSMRCLALEVAKRGIRVNALCPGLVETPLLNMHRDLLENADKAYPLGLGQPEDVAHAAIYFLSDASRKVTGTTFSLDGGIPFT